MKKILFFLVSIGISASLFADYNGLSEARELASQGIIVDQSTTAQQYRINTSLDAQESAMYRLSDLIIRQEVLGIALKIKGVELPNGYACRDFFRDTGEWWVCRAAELSADHGIVTRANLHFRPRDVLTLGEAMGILIKSLNIPLSNTSVNTISGTLPAWQKRLILTIQEKQITLNVRDDNGRSIAVYDSRVGSALSGFDMSHRMTRGEFFQLVVALLDYQNNSDPIAHCTVYNDGCNDCVRGDEGVTCTERACIWQGIPSCSECENGYTLENNRCVKKIASCIGLGGVVSNFSLSPEYQFSGTCCSGLTSVGPKDVVVGAPNICANIGDYICDSRYESSYNSSDCRLVVDSFDSSICQSYFDGCNTCSQTSNGQTICTMMACNATVLPSYCTSYITYVPKTQLLDTAFISKVVAEMRTYAKDLSCTDNSQCQWAMVGSRACGGPSNAIPYSRKNISQSLIDSKTTYITDAEKYFNQYYGIMSDCMYVQPPHPMGCINGTCQ